MEKMRGGSERSERVGGRRCGEEVRWWVGGGSERVGGRR